MSHEFLDWYNGEYPSSAFENAEEQGEHRLIALQGWNARQQKLEALKSKLVEFHSQVSKIPPWFIGSEEVYSEKKWLREAIAADLLEILEANS